MPYALLSSTARGIWYSKVYILEKSVAYLFAQWSNEIVKVGINNNFPFRVVVAAKERQSELTEHLTYMVLDVRV